MNPIRRWLFNFLASCFCLPRFAANQPQFLSTELDPDAFVQNSVNVISGD